MPIEPYERVFEASPGSRAAEEATNIWEIRNYIGRQVMRLSIDGGDVDRITTVDNLYARRKSAEEILDEKTSRNLKNTRRPGEGE